VLQAFFSIFIATLPRYSDEGLSREDRKCNPFSNPASNFKLNSLSFSFFFLFFGRPSAQIHGDLNARNKF